MFTRTMLGHALTALIVATVATAQTPTTKPARNARFTAGATLMGAASVNDFQQYVDRALGAGFNVSYAIDSASRFAIRVDAEWLNHGLESQDARLITPFSGIRNFELLSSNDIFFMEVGPELRLTIAGVPSYIGASAGLAYFVTTASATRNDRNLHVSTTLEQHDAVFAYGGHAGVRVPVAGSRNISLDIGAEYQRSDNASFLRKGDLEVVEDGTLSFVPVEGRADLWILNLGLSVPLTRKRAGK